MVSLVHVRVRCRLHEVQTVRCFGNSVLLIDWEGQGQSSHWIPIKNQRLGLDPLWKLQKHGHWWQTKRRKSLESLSRQDICVIAHFSCISPPKKMEIGSHTLPTKAANVLVPGLMEPVWFVQEIDTWLRREKGVALRMSNRTQMIECLENIREVRFWKFVYIQTCIHTNHQPELWYIWEMILAAGRSDNTPCV